MAPADATSESVELAARPLGLPDLSAHRWRDRAGHAKFREAREAEGRADWPAVVTACQAALTADPTHLEASWLLAAALGRQNDHAALVEPLQTAVAGDFAKWGKASLELPALAAFRETPAGRAWIERVDRDRAVFAQAIARSTIVIADGDLFAIDPESTRWFRLTRTGGTVIAGLHVPAARKLAYVARVVPRYGKATKQREIAVGVVDFASGGITRAVELGTKKGVTVAYSTKAPAGFYVNARPATGAASWRRLEDDFKLVALPPKTTRPAGPYLEVKSRSGAITQLPIQGIVADWDDKGLASAIRLSASNRVLAVPSPGLIDGNTAAWSPQKTHLAFVAQLDETCAPGTLSAAAVVADVTTGKTTELVRATKGLAIEWISDRQLAVAADDGVVVYDLDGAPPRPIEGAQKLATPKKRTRCTDEPELEAPDAPDDPDPDEASDGTVGRPDAGVVEPIQSGKKSTP
ncbi:MAG: tetratricopeptide repeat protein [Kofleriaceae bacterium]